MFKYEIELDSLLEKRSVVHWIEEWIDIKDFDECLTFRRIIFSTDLQMKTEQKGMMLRSFPSVQKIVEEEI